MLRTALLALAINGVVSISGSAADGVSHPLVIRMYDLAEAPSSRVRQAMDQAARILARAGLMTKWEPRANSSEAHVLDQTSTAYRRALDAREYLMVRLVRGLPHRSYPKALGLAIPNATYGAHVTVFYDRVDMFAHSNRADTSTILGAVIAHEIGHVLLGSDKHSVAGVMKAVWNSHDLYEAECGRLSFTEPECSDIRRGAIERTTK